MNHAINLVSYLTLAGILGYLLPPTPWYRYLMLLATVQGMILLGPSLA